MTHSEDSSDSDPSDSDSSDGDLSQDGTSQDRPLREGTLRMAAPRMPSIEEASPRRATSPTIGRIIGPFQLRKLLGKGGMGEVYLADRVDGEFDQQVALKILLRSADEEMLDRFHVERRIQAQLSHPNISRLLDGGTTVEGRPWFAMDAVEGLTIDTYCREHRLNIAQRIEIFCKVCDAVQFAHQRLVIHRDLKPSNILVNSQGEPILLDFGIAKLLSPKKEEEIVLTTTGMQPMTIRYASPEQVREEMISTACDVYSLGVLLHLLLTERLPLGLEAVGFVEAAKRILEQDPEPLSALVLQRAEIPSRNAPGGLRVLEPEKIAADRKTTPAKLRRLLQGDLDAIVLKALRKEPEERPTSATALAEDLRNHLQGLPVAARQGRNFYRLGKTVKRHRWTLLVAFLLLGFVATMTMREVQRLEEEAQRANRASLFLESLFDAADPSSGQGGTISVVDLLEQGRKELEPLKDDPELYTNLAGKLARMYFNYGYLESAVEFSTEALEVWREAKPGDSPELADRLNNLALMQRRVGNIDQAEKLYREALQMRSTLGGPEFDNIPGLDGLGHTLVEKGKYEEALRLYRETLAIRQRQPDADPIGIGRALRNTGRLLLWMGQLDEAENLLLESLEIRRAHYGEESVAVLLIYFVLGDLAIERGDPILAEEIFTDVLEMGLRILGDHHELVAMARQQVANAVLENAVLLEEPAPAVLTTTHLLLDDALANHYSEKSLDSRHVLETHAVLGEVLTAQGKVTAGTVCLEDSYARLVERMGVDAFPTRIARKRLARAFHQAEALPAN